jgi:hypothetical protein
MAVKALQLLQPAKGENEGYGNGSGHFAKHKQEGTETRHCDQYGRYQFSCDSTGDYGVLE